MYKEDYNMPRQSVQSAFCATILLLAVSSLGVAADHGSTPTSAPCGVVHDNGSLKLAGIPTPIPEPWFKLAGIPTPIPEPWFKLAGIPTPIPEPWLKLAGIPTPIPEPWFV
jgi:hypothetical protein